MNIKSFSSEFNKVKMIKSVLFLALLVISFNLKCQTNEVQPRLDISIKGEYPAEAILEAKNLYRNDLEKLNFVLEQINLYEKMGVHILSSKQFEVIKEKRESFPKNPTNESQIAEIKKIQSYLNDTFKSVTAIK